MKKGDSVITLNEQTTYNTWEFIYDPRIEQLKAKAGLLGGGATGGAWGRLPGILRRVEATMTLGREIQLGFGGAVW